MKQIIMGEQLVGLEVAKLAKEKGCNLQVSKYYNVDVLHKRNYKDNFNRPFVDSKNLYSAPTQSLLQKWLREKYNIHFNILGMTMVGFVMYYNIEILIQGAAWDKPKKVTGKTYEEALEEALLEALKSIK